MAVEGPRRFLALLEFKTGPGAPVVVERAQEGRQEALRAYLAMTPFRRRSGDSKTVE
jgi:hypothetical protein